MEKKSNYKTEKDLLFLLEQTKEKKIFPEKYYQIFLGFYKSYKQAIVERKEDMQKHLPLFFTLLDLAKNQFLSPHPFDLYHKKIRKPFDYYAFGLDFFRPLVDFPKSSVEGKNQIDAIEKIVQKKENVILFANHQSELDPQAISLLLEKDYSHLAENIIYVAGERVISDPLAVPFSLGCDLLCIYSKKYIHLKPELQHTRQMHNKKTMSLLSQLLSEGGKIIYIAPSGGRDRCNDQGKVVLAPFDPQSIELLYLMAKKALKPTHFFPLALATYQLLPPPRLTQVEMGEKRMTKYSDIHLSFGAEIDMKKFPGSDAKDKHEKRENRCSYIFQIVNNAYNLITG